MHSANFKTYNSREELEKARAKEAAGSSYTERFYAMMQLIRLSDKIRKAKIISSPQLPSKQDHGHS